MIFALFRGRRAEANQKLIGRLHDEIVAAARNSAFYLDHGVADTFEGRFELLVLLAGLVLRRLDEAEAPGPDVAQELVDTIFRRLDGGMREMGVGDLAVPKRMKKLVQAFLGRAAAYDAAATQGIDALAEVIARNVFDGHRDGKALAAYAIEMRRLLTERTLDDCLRLGLAFPDPATLVSGARS